MWDFRKSFFWILGAMTERTFMDYFLRKTYLLMCQEIWIPSGDSYRYIKFLDCSSFCYGQQTPLERQGESQWKISHEPSAWIVQKSSKKAALTEAAAIFTSSCKMHDWVLLESFLTQYPPSSLVKDCNLDCLNSAISALTLNIAHWAEWKTWPSAKVLKTVDRNQKK